MGLHETFSRMYMTRMTRKNWLNFGRHPHIYPDLEIFKRFVQHFETVHFSHNFAHISGKKLIGSSRQFHHRYIFGEESSRNVSEVIPMRESGSLNSGSLNSIFALVEVYAQRVASRKECSGGNVLVLSLIHIWRCRRIERCRSRWSPYH